MRRRGKVVLKLIEDKSSRHVAFSKRRSGLFKKASELSVLCDVEVALIVFSTGGKAFEFHSGQSLRETFDHYLMHSRGHNMDHGNVTSKQFQLGCRSESKDSFQGKNIQHILQRFLEGDNNEQFSFTDLMQIEEILDAIQRETRNLKERKLMEEYSQEQIEVASFPFSKIM